MTRSEREQIIQRYLSGEMSSAEEGDFFIQVALDNELRHDLQAQQTIESAFRKDREAERTGHTALRTRVASMLAGAPSPVRPSAPAETPAPAPAEIPAPAEEIRPVTAPGSPSPSLPGTLARRGGGLGGWAALAFVVALLVLLLDPFGPTHPPEPTALPAKSGDDISRPTQQKDGQGSTAAPGVAPSERSSIPAAPAPVTQRRPAAQERASQERASQASPRGDLGARERSSSPDPVGSTSARNPSRKHSAASPSHEDTEDDGARHDPASERMKVGVKVQIRPHQ
jgi:hypothetical protein